MLLVYNRAICEANFDEESIWRSFRLRGEKVDVKYFGVSCSLFEMLRIGGHRARGCQR